MSLGRDQFLAALAAIKAGTTTRAQRRRQVAALVTAGQEWLARHDTQSNASAQAFADSKPAQYQTFLDALPAVTVDAADPADQVP